MRQGYFFPYCAKTFKHTKCPKNSLFYLWINAVQIFLRNRYFKSGYIACKSTQIVLNFYIGRSRIFGVMTRNSLQHIGSILYIFRNRTDLIQ
ncbi:hypothetical protein D3C78_1137920 [compost metagenome]